MNILILEGDGIGPEIMSEAIKVLNNVASKQNLKLNLKKADIGGVAVDKHNNPFPDATLSQAKKSDAILLGAVGGPKWDNLARDMRPETGLLKIRESLNLFANLRPAICYKELANSSSLKPEIIENLDLLIVRELTGGIYFGKPRGITENDSGEKVGLNSMVYSETEVEKIAKVAFNAALVRNKKLCSVDKANVLEVSQLWRDKITSMSSNQDLELSHMYVDNAVMQLVKQPKQFDVIVTGNMFGDILSDCAAMLTGSIGMLPSASLNDSNFGLFEPVHGSAPDIAGKNLANPLAMILSVAMMLRYTFRDVESANLIENAVKSVISKGFRTTDISDNTTNKDNIVSCSKMGDLVCEEI